MIFDTSEQFLIELASRMWQGHHWRKGPEGPRMSKAPLLPEDLARHAEGGTPVGLCPIAPGTGLTSVGLIDLDSHKGLVPWENMLKVAQRLEAFGLPLGLRPIPFRSSGGKGIHLLYIWDEPQSARAVRVILRQALRAVGMVDKAGPGVGENAAEIFPKQNHVPADGFGSMFILPFARESLALDMENDWNHGYTIPTLTPSDPLPALEAPAPALSALEPAEAQRAELGEIQAALDRIDPNDLDYDDWLALMFSVHSGTEGSAEGLALFDEWSQRTTRAMSRGAGGKFLAEEWARAKDKPGGITIGTLLKRAREGYTDTELAADFEDVRGAADSKVQDAAPSAPVSTGAAPLTIEWTSLADLDVNRPPPIDWVVEGWLAAGTVATLFAQGGFGKSLIGQQLLTSVANARDWLGMQVSAGPAVGIFAEEDINEQRRRQERIFRAYGLDSGPGSERLHLTARAGAASNVLVSFDRSKRILGSKLFRAVSEAVERLKPRVTVLDNTAQMFGGEESDRHEVTAFLNALAGIAVGNRTAILVLGHTSKSEESEFSGSTAWSNVGRTRLFLKREEDGSSILSVAKTNLGVPRSITINYQDGVFVPYLPSGGTPQLHAAYDVLIRSLNEYVAQGRGMRETPGLNYLISAIVEDGLAEGLPAATLRRAMADLLVRRVILIGQPIGRHSNRTQKFGMKVTDNKEIIPNPLIGNESVDLF